jgi:hypothetical protein
VVPKSGNRFSEQITLREAKEAFMSDISGGIEATTGAEDTRRADLERQASLLVERARTRLGATVEPITERARAFAEAKKQSGAETLGGAAAAVHRAAGSLEPDLPRAAGYARHAADALQQASAALKERSLDELVGSVGQFARKQPAAFFGAAVLTGFALSRFLKSAAER